MRQIVFLALLFATYTRADDRIPQVGLYTPERRELPNGGYLPKEVPFPQIVDLSTLKIKLERGPCYGECPVYTVEIRGDGSVSYSGDGFVAISGHHRAMIPKASINQLLAAFREARFFSLLDSYALDAKDDPTSTISISFDDHTKTVFDESGFEAGMPEAAAQLEALIDTLVTDRWIKGGNISAAMRRMEAHPQSR